MSYLCRVKQREIGTVKAPAVHLHRLNRGEVIQITKTKIVKIMETSKINTGVNSLSTLKGQARRTIQPAMAGSVR